MRCSKYSQMQLKQQGTVLVTVLLVVAFVVILLVEVRKTVNYQATLNRNFIHRDQAFSYLTGMEELAKIYLKKAFEAEKEDVVHLNQAWAQDGITFPIDGGGMTATITDMQSCLNLNSLGILDAANNSNVRGTPATNLNPGGEKTLATAQPQRVTPSHPNQQNQVTTGEKILTSLLEKVMENTEIQPAALASELRDWIDEDLTPSGPDGVEDLYYQGLDVPYLPPNGPIAHVSELRSIKSFNKAIYERIRNYICVLPNGEDNIINVNTITAERAELLYAALGGKVSQGNINQLISDRPEEGYADMQEFWSNVGSNIEIKQSLKTRLDVTSRYFQMDARAEINRTRVYMKTLFVKQDDNNFKVVSRYFGKE